MNHETCKELIKDHLKLIERPHSISIRRTVFSTIEKKINEKSVLIISGIRKSGKTFLLGQIINNLRDRGVPLSNIFYINCKDERLAEQNADNHTRLIETYRELYSPQGKKYFFFDEIERIKNFTLFLDALVSDDDVKIIITTQNQSFIKIVKDKLPLKKKETFILYPLSFQEYIKAFNKNFPFEKNIFTNESRRIEIKKLLNDYIFFGGFPQICIEKDTTILQNYYQEILYRDIISKYLLKNVQEIKLLALHIFSNNGSIYSYRNLLEIIAAKSTNSIKNYLTYLEDVFLIYRVNLFSNSIKRRIFNPSKLYPIDTALAGSLSYLSLINPNSLYENVVFLELKRRGENIFYYRTEKGDYIHFLLRKGIKITGLIEVVKDLSTLSPLPGKVKSVLKATKALKENEILIITDGYLKDIKIEGIWVRCIPLFKWLLT